MYPLLELSELPVIPNPDTVKFIVPIHPSLLRQDVTFDRNIPGRLFSESRIIAKQRLNDLVRGNTINFSNFAAEHNCLFDERNFVTSFAYSKAATLGVLFFNPKEPHISGLYRGLFLSKEKLPSYQNEERRLFIYDRHNVDSLSQAFMLQTWAVLCMNEYLKTIP